MNQWCFSAIKIKKMIAFKWMVERKQEPPWGGIKQLNFPLLRGSPTTSLNGKGHRTLQQNISETRCTTALGHDMLPGYPTKASLSLTWQEQQMGQMADQNRRGRLRERERRWWFSCRGKRCIPFMRLCAGAGVSETKFRGSRHLDWVLLKRQTTS